MLRLASMRARSLAGVGGSALAIQLLAGCYQYVPVDASTSVPLRRDVAVEITDRGRFELGGAIGTSPTRVEGRILSASDTTLTLAVRNVHAIDGSTTPWAGEAVTVRRSGIAGVRERRLSAARTGLLAGLFAGAVALVFTVGLSVFGGSSNPGTDTGGPGGET